MGKKWVVGIVLAFLLSIPAPTLLAEEISTYLIGFKDEVEEELLQESEGVVLETWDEANVVALEISEDRADWLRQQEEVAFVEADETIAVETPPLPAFQQSQAEWRNWGIDHIGATEAWEYGIHGDGVSVAVIDSGIDTSHPSLDVKGGYSSVSYTDDYDDDHGHGTHVAGIIAANHPSVGLMGVAPNVDLYAVKVLDHNGFATLTAILRGVQWAMDEEMDIINMSLGTLTDSEAMKRLLETATEEGIVVVAAVGNRGESAEGTSDRIEFPARYDTTIGVGAVDENNERASFSASGQAVEFVAPGVDIVSTFKERTYGPLSGTSMAAPFVSGAFALLMDAYPDLSPDELKTMLIDEVIDLGEPGRDPRYGYGLLQLPDMSEAPGREDRNENEREEPDETPIEEDIDDDLIGDDPIMEDKILISLTTDIETDEDGTPKVTLTWEASEALHESHEFHLYRNDEQIARFTDDETFYTDDEVEADTYTYTLVVVDDQGREYGTSDKVEVDLTSFEEELSFTWPEKIANPPQFADIADDFWAKEAIDELSARGIINGRDGHFYPNEAIRRGQIVAIMGRLFDWDDKDTMTHFTDVPRDYFSAGYIQAAAEKGIISGYNDNTFRPNDAVTRGQMAQIIGRAFDIPTDDLELDTAPFSDVTEETTGYEEIVYFAKHGIIHGYQDGTFQPNNTLTRAQFAQIVYTLGQHVEAETKLQ